MSLSKSAEAHAIPHPALPIIDAHHHLFDRPGARYLLDEYRADVEMGHNIVASVYVEGGAFHRIHGPEVLRPLGEIEFANGVGAMCDGGFAGGRRLCAAIVGNADLRRGAEIGVLLDRAMAVAPDRFRGIRQMVMDHPSDVAFRFFMTGRPPQGLYHHPRFREGLAEIAARGLSYDATGFHLQIDDIIGLADTFPNLPVILNNMTIAMGIDMNAHERAALFAEWRRGLQEAARRPNIHCKVGGLGMPHWGFGFEERQPPPHYHELADAWRPFVLAAIEAFGVDRCMMASNFPPDRRSGSYSSIWSALKHVTADFSPSERTALFSDTAARLYRIDPPG